MCFMGNGYAYEGAWTPHNLSCGFETLTKRLDCIKGLLKFDMGKVGVSFSEILWVILLHLKESFGLFLISLNGNIN